MEFGHNPTKTIASLTLINGLASHRCSVHAGQHQTIALIEQLTIEQNSIIRLCELFKIARSSYHYHLKNRGKFSPERASLREKAV